MKKKYNILHLLPIYIRKKNKHWYWDSKNNKRIHVSNILKYVVQPAQEPKDLSNYWWNKI